MKGGGLREDCSNGRNRGNQEWDGKSLPVKRECGQEQDLGTEREALWEEENWRREGNEL